MGFVAMTTQREREMSAMLVLAVCLVAVAIWAASYYSYVNADYSNLLQTE